MSQFTALMFKNFALYRRAWCCSILELLVIFGIATMVFVLRRLMDVEPQMETSFIGNTNYTLNLPSPSLLVPGFIMNCTRTTVNGYLTNGGKIALAPPQDPLISKLSATLTSLNYSTIFFDDAEAIARHIRDPAYGGDLDPICFGVSVESSSNSNYTYSLWFNITGSNTTTQGPRTDKETTILSPFSRTNFQPLIISGMMEVQNLMNNYILQQESGNPNAMISGKISPMRQEAYDYDDWGSMMYDAFDFMLTLPIAIIYLRMTGVMMLEKERKIKEVMKVMGMTNTSYYGSWILHEFLVFFVASAFNAGMVHATLPRVDFFVVLLLYLLYSLVLIAQSLFIQVWFTKAKIAILSATFLFGFQFMMCFLFKNSLDQTLDLSSGVSVSPIAGVSLALLAMLQYHSMGQSVNFGNITEPMSQIRISTVFAWQAVNIVVWFLLFLYLEQVFKNEWGAKQHPLFICQWLSKLCRRSKVHNELDQASSDLAINDLIQVGGFSEGSTDYVEISELTKIYEGSDRKSLDNLTLKMEKGQIFCLLGHNGAGKTTTVGVLTGMYEPTSGRVNVFGLDLKTRLHQIRKIMGYCPQHNTLYDDLTVEEHLRLFGRFKGFTGVQA
jgi:ATP-binding cassette subfamily A (ABC1) protein 3